MMRWNWKLTAVFFSITIVACSRGDDYARSEGIWTSETAWTVADTPRFELAGRVLEEVPADPVNVLRSGHEYLVPDGAANGSHRVLVYDESGRYVGAWGKKGEGPGEFAHLDGWSGVFRVDSVAVEDGGANEIEIFSSSGVSARAIKLPIRGRLLGLMPNGNLVLSSSRVPNIKDSLAVVIYGEGKEPIRTIHAFPLPPTTHGFTDPYVGPRPTLAAGHEHIYYTNGIDFAVDVYDTLGRQVRTLRRNLARLPMTNKDREEIIQQLVGEYRERPGQEQIATQFEKILRTGGRWSEYMIAWGSVLEDSEGNVWLEHYRAIYPHIERKDARRTTWSVFGPAGRFLGELTIPPRVTVLSVSNNEVLGFWKDDLDVKHVAVYPITKPGRAN